MDIVSVLALLTPPHCFAKIGTWNGGELIGTQRGVPLLNQLTISNARPREKAYKLSDGNGLTLLIQPTGKNDAPKSSALRTKR